MMDAHSSDDASFSFGEFFSSYCDLKAKIKTYERHMLESSRPRLANWKGQIKVTLRTKLTEAANPQPVYYSIYLSSINKQE